MVLSYNLNKFYKSTIGRNPSDLIYAVNHVSSKRVYAYEMKQLQVQVEVYIIHHLHC